MTAFIIGMVLAAVAFVLTGCSAAVSAPVTAQNAAWINPGQCPADSPLSAPQGFSSVRVRLPGEPTTAAGYRKHVAWPTDLTSIGPGHFTYFHRVHGCLPLGGGRWLVTKSQNWDDGKIRPTSAYMILFSEWSN